MTYDNLKKIVISTLFVVSLQPVIWFPLRQSCAGSIKAYFSQPVSASAARGETASGAADLAGLSADFIDSATSSIDICAYNISDYEVSDALISAKNRGVEVRVIVEHDNRDSGAISDLESAGITIIDDSYGHNSGDESMHNKFIVRDCRGDSNPENDAVWTGSYNFSYSGSEDNCENAVIIPSHEVAVAFTDEFDEMWGSSTITPGFSTSRFGTRKTDNIDHFFNVDGIPLEIYMSPSDGTNDRIINEIENSSKGINFCIFSFTRDDVSGAMKERRDHIPGYYVEGVFDSSAVGSYSEYWNMKGLPQGDDPWDPPASVFLSINQPEDALLHHKYMIIDPGETSARVITGSHNWSTSACSYNDENLLIIRDPGLADQYRQEFRARYFEAKGSSFPIYDIQYSELPSGASTFEGRKVNISGTVTAIFEDANLVFIADSTGGAWSGIPLYHISSTGISRGDVIKCKGTVSEFYNLTEISDISSVETVSSGGSGPPPRTLSTGEVSVEENEGVLVELKNAVVTDANLGYGEWEVDDGTGTLVVDDMADYDYSPVLGDTLKVLRGIVYYSYGEFKLEPRDNDDFSETGVKREKDSEPSRAKRFVLLRSCRPDPFNPSTMIPVSVEKRSHVRLSVYDIAGKLIENLTDRTLDAGDYCFKWDGRSKTGSPVSSGVYCFILEAYGNDGKQVRTVNKAVLLK